MHLFGRLAVLETHTFEILGLLRLNLPVLLRKPGQSFLRSVLPLYLSPLLCVHAPPKFVAKCQTGTLSLVCGDTTSGCLLRNYCILRFVRRIHMSIPADLEEFVVRPSSPPHHIT